MENLKNLLTTAAERTDYRKGRKDFNDGLTSKFWGSHEYQMGFKAACEAHFLKEQKYQALARR